MIGISLSMAGNPSQVTVIQQAIAVLRKYGSDAHVYLPGVGTMNGLTAGNYLDSAGTTQGTVDQPVGLVLDAAGGLGVELVTNGDFSAGATGWAGFGAGGWTVTGNAATHTAGTYGLIQFNTPKATALKTYKVAFDCTLTAGDIKCYIGGVASTTFITGGAKEVFVVAGASPSYLIAFEPSTSFSGSIDNISVREVTGIAASQPTTASKPILRRGAVNLLTYSGAFSNAAWTKASGATISATGITDYLGGTSAVTVAVPSSAGGGLTQVKTTWSAGGSGTCLVYAKRASSGSATAVRLTTNNQAAWNTGVSAKLVLTTQWQIVPLSGVLSTTTDCKLLIGCSDATGAVDADCVGNVDVCFAGLFQGTYTAAQIQDLGGIPLTTTAPASTALGPQWWSFDGSNDSLSLGGPLFQMADDHCVVAGAMCSSAVALFVAVSAAHSADGVIYSGVIGNRGTTGKVFAEWSGGATVAIDSSTSFVNTPYVATARSISGSKSLRVNAALQGTSAVAVSGAVAEGDIGRFRAAAPFSFPGSIYPVIAIKGTVPDADLLLLEKFVANLSGVTL